MAKKGGLGKGLDSIYIDNSVETSESSGAATLVRLSKIEPNPNQPRHRFDNESLSELADSIASNGIIQPIVVRPAKTQGFYSIIAGERRWRASKMAGLSEVPVIIMDIDDKKASELALIENVQRKDLDPIEEALGFKSLIEDYGLTQADAASRVGKSRVAVTNALRLLELPSEVIVLLQSYELSTGHARALLGLKNPEFIVELAKETVKNAYSVRVVEEKVRKLNSTKETLETITEDPQKDEYYKALENKATQKLGSKIKIKRSGKIKSVNITFADTDELENILVKLCGNDLFEDIV